jgi:N,N'-diacetyllegionaminate synthase
MSNWQELDTAINFLSERKADITLMQCTTAYPAPAMDWGLRQIEILRDRYHLPVGYSDHGGTPVAGIAAAALGAAIIECHVVFDKRMFGPDAKASLTIDEVKFLAEAVKQVNEGLQSNDLKSDSNRFDELKIMFGKSLAVNKDLEAGVIITIDDLESKKPGDQGIPAADFEKLVGKKLKNDKSRWDFLKWEDISH